MEVFRGGAAEAEGQAHRLRLAPSRIYACRFCREAVKVTSTRYLPEECPACRASTWEEDGRCANWASCTAVRRPGVRGRAHCHACGYTIWSVVGTRVGSSGRVSAGA
jgi:hypothetical protein